jgi:hypothetical protein
MICRVLIAVISLILLALPRNASATQPPIVEWVDQGVTAKVSGSCVSQDGFSLLIISLYAQSAGHDCDVPCDENGHFSVTFPSPDFPNEHLVAGDAVVVNDLLGTDGPVTIYAPPFGQPASVTLGNLAQTYDGTPRNATVTTVPPGLAYTITYDGGSAAPVLAGSHPVSVTVTDPGYTGSTTGTLVISQASQTITFAALDPVELGVQPIVLSASISSGLPITYTSSDPLVASVSGSTVTVHAAGTATITASQGGDPTSYFAAAEVQRDLVVSLPSIPVPATPGWTLFGLAALFFALGTMRLSRNPGKAL